MKWIMALLLLVIPAQTSKPRPASTIIAEALNAATMQGKTVFIHFGASWCTWCKHLDEMLNSPEVGSIFKEHYILVNLTVQESDDKKALENPGAQEFVDQSGGVKAGVPYYVFLDGDGKQIATSAAMPAGVNIGYPATPDEIRTFGELLGKTAPRMTTAQRVSVVDYLTKHAPKN